MNSPVDIWNSSKTGTGPDINPVSLSKWQHEKLEAALDNARENTGFYKSLPRGIRELSDLPFTTPADLVKDPCSFLALPMSKVERISTHAGSGTTRLLKRIFFSEGDLERTKEFFAAGMSAMVSKGDNVRILISSETENSLGSLLKESLSGIGVASGISASVKSAAMAVREAQGADCLVGMPAELLYMSCIAPALRPGSVLFAADIAPECMTERIRKNWQCDVFTHYGHTEFGYGCAVDCSYHEGLHLRHADLIFEVIDPVTDKPAAPGKSGEVVITSLSNEAMPLIRYRTGHISRLTETPCGCGSVLPRLERIEGRYNNLINVSKDTALDIFNIDKIVFSDPGVRGMDASYDSLTKTLLLTIDSKDRFDDRLLKEVLNEEVSIRITYGEADPFEKRGKRKIRII